MPQLRSYPQATQLNLTDALLLDQLGMGTRWCTLQQLLDFILAELPVAPYDVAMGYSQPPPPNSTFLTFIAARAFSLPAGLGGSVAEFVVGPASPVVLTILKNGATVGVITFPAVGNGGSVGVLSSSVATTFNPGDLLEIASGAALFGASNLAVTFEGVL